MKLHVEKVALKKPIFYLSILKMFSLVGKDGIWIKDRSRWQWWFCGLRDPWNKAENIFGALVWKFWLTIPQDVVCQNSNASKLCSVTSNESFLSSLYINEPYRKDMLFRNMKKCLFSANLRLKYFDLQPSKNKKQSVFICFPVTSLKFITVNSDELVPFLLFSIFCLLSKNLLFNFYFILTCEAPFNTKTAGPGAVGRLPAPSPPSS